jgi:hypothetical protein
MRAALAAGPESGDPRAHQRPGISDLATRAAGVRPQRNRSRSSSWLAWQSRTGAIAAVTELPIVLGGVPPSSTTGHLASVGVRGVLQDICRLPPPWRRSMRRSPRCGRAASAIGGAPRRADEATDARCRLVASATSRR